MSKRHSLLWFWQSFSQIKFLIKPLSVRLNGIYVLSLFSAHHIRWVLAMLRYVTFPPTKYQNNGAQNVNALPSSPNCVVFLWNGCIQSVWDCGGADLTPVFVYKVIYARVLRCMESKTRYLSSHVDDTTPKQKSMWKKRRHEINRLISMALIIR